MFQRSGFCLTSTLPHLNLSGKTAANKPDQTKGMMHLVNIWVPPKFL